MSAAYRIAPEVAWVDGADTGRQQSIAWITRLDTTELFELQDAGWLVWILLADGISTAEGIVAEIDALEATVDFADEGIEGFLAGLEANGLIIRA